MKKSPLRAIDLFCGAGGSSWGAAQAGAAIVAAFDLSSLAGSCHKDNIPGAKFHHGRIEDCDIKRLRNSIGQIDLLLASPECTSHSPARGKKERSDVSRDTAFEVPRFAKAFMPRWIIIENVVGMRRWKRYPELKQELTNLGYQITEQVLNAADFGVPQSRRRLFLLCDLRGTPAQLSPPKCRKARIRPLIALDETYRWTPLEQPRRAKATLERAKRGIEALGPGKAFLLVYYGSDHAGGWQSLSRPLRTVTTVDRFAIVRPTPKGYMMRMLQVPEIQRAMGMDKMRFEHGTRRDRIRMLGNAVCPPVMKAVVEHLTKSS